MGRKRSVSRSRYCEFLASSQINWTQTYFAEHTAEFAHDAVQRYLRGDRVTAAEVWTRVRPHLNLSPNGFIVFDDSVLDKNHSRRMALVRKQWSGNEKRAIRGLGLVTCVYVNPDTREFWIVDFRIFSPDDDGKSKADHVMDMWRRLLEKERAQEISFRSVLMDTWYAINAVMLRIQRAGKIFCCPVKGNRNVLVPDPAAGGETPRQRADTLVWDEETLEGGQTVRLNGWPGGVKVKMFRVVLSTGRTELVVTNDPALLTTDGVRATYAVRWFVEVFHRELKQVTGVEACQCRLARAQRNHIGCALLVWIELSARAKSLHRSIYSLKTGLLSAYMRAELAQPTFRFA